MNIPDPISQRIPVGVVVERRKARSPWADMLWRPVSVLAGRPAAEIWSLLSEEGEAATFYAGPAEIALYRSESGNYRQNLETGAPMVWVKLHETGEEPPYAVAGVTADPAEGEGWTEPAQAVVEAVPMPDPVREQVAEFVARHPPGPGFVKRRRDRADPEALARRRPRSGDRMTGDEGFLTRWSRRKRAAPTHSRKHPPSGAADPASVAPEPASAPPELPPLPPIEAIDAASDITPFLAPGVPASLTQAALRRAWTADPAIRDFIGLSENAWDFTAPDGVPGFGSLDADQVRRLVEYLFAQPAPARGAKPANAIAAPSGAPSDTQSEEPGTPAAQPRPDPPGTLVAAQLPPEPAKRPDSGWRRRHGGALPQ